MSESHQSYILIRSNLKSGDIGYIIYLHGILYAEEYHWNRTFEAYVADGLAGFVLAYNPDGDRIWIGERDGEIVGCIAIVGASASEAQLRWLLVHSDLRGKGLGRRLMNEAMRFCREQGYGSVFLWTTSDLKAAAHLYLSTGFHKTDEKTHEIWGQTVTEERYEMSL